LAKTILRLLLPVLLFGRAAFAQQTPAWEFFGGYSIERTDVREYYKSSPTIYTFRDRYINLNGWEVAVTENVNKRFGGTFQVTGHYKSPVAFGTTTNQRIHSVMYGPRVAQRVAFITAYGHVLFGIGRTTAEVSPGPHLTQTEFVAAGGAGVDVHLGSKIGFRPLQIQYSPMNQVGVRNHKFDASAGLVFYVGTRK
jgi:hypothetical protein